jgi:hypothetical protein
MANKYALFPFTWQNGAGASIFCDAGALRDSASAVVSAVPSAFTSAITLAATGVAAPNPNPVPVSATVSGGTVTGISISGVSTGQTSGTFTVPAGGTIAVTYSVAPTLTTADIAPAAGTNVNGVLAQYLAANTAGP